MTNAWSRTRRGGWRVAQSPVLGTTITINRLKQRGHTPLSEIDLSTSLVCGVAKYKLDTEKIKRDF